jgi:hypothetical protein
MPLEELTVTWLLTTPPTGVQVLGVRLSAYSNVYPTTSVGHERVSWLPARE